MRFVRLAEADRLCQVCAKNKIENEYHFLFECSEYTEYRAELETAINVNLAILSTEDKFVNVFNHPHSLSRYITRAFKKRREKLYRST